eukprot:1996046-Rhodomonas_salina.1
MSGAKGHSYTLSLRSVVKDYRGLSDFEHINGVDGVYIANVIDASEQVGLSSVLLPLARLPHADPALMRWSRRLGRGLRL